MRKLERLSMILFFSLLMAFVSGGSGCSDGGDARKPVDPADTTKKTFYFGADLSYANQILDHGGVFKDEGEVRSPYQIFHDHGTTLARFRIWHNPAWTKTVYEPEGTQLYNDLLDVEKSIRLSKEQGMKVLLDFHYSDTWADPGQQRIPDAWTEIRNIDVLVDSVYNYTAKTLSYLDNKGLMPEFVQLGNEINCGMLYTDAPAGFPACDACNGQWTNLKKVINAGIKAVRDVSSTSVIKSKILIHVADPKNIEWWFDNLTSGSVVTDFDIIGISYYPIWHTTVSVQDLGARVETFKTKYKKDVMILETAYPWTASGDDSYTNLFGSQSPISGYPYTQTGQYEMMKTITQQLKNGGAIGIVYWEPDWITCEIKDQWNMGSAWENCTFFDFDDNTLQGIDYMKYSYN